MKYEMLDGIYFVFCIGSYVEQKLGIEGMLKKKIIKDEQIVEGDIVFPNSISRDQFSLFYCF